MALKFKLTEDDYITFNKSHFERSPSMKKTFSRLRIYMTVIMFAIPLLLSMTIAEFTYLWIGVIAGIALAAAAWFYYPKFYWNTVTKSLKRALRGGKKVKEPWIADCTLEMDDKGVSFKMGQYPSSSPYSAITDIVTDEFGYTYIYFTGLQGAIIPPAVDGSEAFISELKEMVRLNQ
ncbi:MAG: hypothetical protein Q4Q53_00900 [Methanocorpusculum sp.]|nr:hypothetical protein [Methanocorpusculum sp.]